MEFQYDEEASEHLTALDKDRAFTSSSSLLCSVIHQCRICHEEEPSETCVMETPCACSGTLKVPDKIINDFFFCDLFFLFDLILIVVAVCSPRMHPEVVR